MSAIKFHKSFSKSVITVNLCNISCTQPKKDFVIPFSCLVHFFKAKQTWQPYFVHFFCKLRNSFLQNKTEFIESVYLNLILLHHTSFLIVHLFVEHGLCFGKFVWFPSNSVIRDIVCNNRTHYAKHQLSWNLNWFKNVHTKTNANV